MRQWIKNSLFGGIEVVRRSLPHFWKSLANAGKNNHPCWHIRATPTSSSLINSTRTLPPTADIEGDELWQGQFLCFECGFCTAWGVRASTRSLCVTTSNCLWLRPMWLYVFEILHFAQRVKVALLVVGSPPREAHPATCKKFGMQPIIWRNRRKSRCSRKSAGEVKRIYLFLPIVFAFHTFPAFFDPADWLIFKPSEYARI